MTYASTILIAKPLKVHFKIFKAALFTSKNFTYWQFATVVTYIALLTSFLPPIFTQWSISLHSPILAFPEILTVFLHTLGVTYLSLLCYVDTLKTITAIKFTLFQEMVTILTWLDFVTYLQHKHVLFGCKTPVGFPTVCYFNSIVYVHKLVATYLGYFWIWLFVCFEPLLQLLCYTSVTISN